MATSVLVPAKSDGMSIYRKKLAYIANDRNRARGGLGIAATNHVPAQARR